MTKAKPTLDEIKLLNMQHLLNNMLARRASFERIAQVRADIEILKNLVKRGWGK